MNSTEQATQTLRARWDQWLILGFAAILLVLPLFLRDAPAAGRTDAAEGEIRLGNSLSLLTEYSWTGLGLSAETIIPVEATPSDAFLLLRARRFSEDLGLDASAIAGELVRQNIPLKEKGQTGALSAGTLFSGQKLVSAWLELPDGSLTSLRDASARMPEGVTQGDVLADDIIRIELYGPASPEPPHGSIMRLAARTDYLQMQQWLRLAERADPNTVPGELCGRIRVMYHDGAVLEYRVWPGADATLLACSALGDGFLKADVGLGNLLDNGWEATALLLQQARSNVELAGLRVKETDYVMGPYVVRGDTEREQLQTLSKKMGLAGTLEKTEYIQLRWRLQSTSIEGRPSEDVIACFLFQGENMVCTWLEAPWANTAESVNKPDRVALNDKSWMQ